MYDAKNETAFSLEDCQAAVGKKAKLVITGKIRKARESPMGAYVLFEIDKRFGLPLERVGLDLDALELMED